MHVRSLKKIKAYQFVGRVTKTGAIVRFHCDLFHPPADGQLCHVTGCVFDTQSKLVKCQVHRRTNSTDEGDESDEGDEADQRPLQHTEPGVILESAEPLARKRARVSFDIEQPPPAALELP